MRTGVILAGGESYRFGEEKAFASFHGRPMVLSVAEALAGYCGELVVSVGSREQEARMRTCLPAARLVRDIHRGRGPIEGFRRGFETAHGDLVLTAPCDAPLLRPELYETLLSHLANHEAVVPRLSVIDPLRAVYRRSAVLRVLGNSARGIPSPAALVDRLDAVHLSEGVLREVDPGLLSFIDVSRQEDLTRAERASGKDIR